VNYSHKVLVVLVGLVILNGCSGNTARFDFFKSGEEKSTECSVLEKQENETMGLLISEREYVQKIDRINQLLDQHIDYLYQCNTTKKHSRFSVKGLVDVKRQILKSNTFKYDQQNYGTVRNDYPEYVGLEKKEAEYLKSVVKENRMVEMLTSIEHQGSKSQISLNNTLKDID
jgi:hypothetical protein